MRMRSVESKQMAQDCSGTGSPSTTGTGAAPDITTCVYPTQRAAGAFAIASGGGNTRNSAMLTKQVFV